MSRIGMFTAFNVSFGVYIDWYRNVEGNGGTRIMVHTILCSDVGRFLQKQSDDYFATSLFSKNSPLQAARVQIKKMIVLRQQ